ncbi:hypothetical protein [Mesorhizobium sp. BE184]|uniref:hypothetical protein n=1 Tax=Mesorhizobium sp. BE184 TaxID=2817714 RepID=UPI00286144A6|nr:hypothetical protein [Mesorhizobium sp. BE184]MDR7034478.1 hypothetical protein [Mesorhizobium sp. BE184]
MAAIISLLAGALGINRALAGILAAAVALTAVSGVLWGGYELVKHWGAEEVRDQIQKENQNAIHKGLDARMSFDECLAAGGVYDFQRQRCSGPALGTQ